MKIIILKSSPNKNGSSNMLADHFRQGAEEAGHTVEVIDVAHAQINPCIGCVHCGYEGPCVQKDDVETIRRQILDADMMALLSAAWNSDNWTFEALESHYKTLVRYLNLEDVGTVLATGCGTPSMTKASAFPKAAYMLCRSLK